MVSSAPHADYPIMLVRTTREIEGYTVNQPLGAMYLVSALRKEGFRNIKLLDMRLDRLTPEQLLEQVRQFQPRLLGLSSFSYEAPVIDQIIRMVRELNPKIHICIGGPFPSSVKEQVFSLIQPPDSICIGEGEQTICDLAKRLGANGRDAALPELDGIKGIHFLREGSVVKNPARELITDVDNIAMPDWDAIDMTKYFTHLKYSGVNFFLKHNRYMTVMTARGCPFHCVYCHDVLGKQFRPRSADSVMSEIYALIKKFGIREIQFVDDVFNLDLDRAKAIFDEIAKIRPRIAVAMPNGIRADRIDEEFLEKAKKAGVYRMMVAVESASPRIQKLVKRHLDIDKVREMVRICDRLNIMAHGLFMLGFPTETEEEMLQTVEWAATSRLHTANFFAVNPFQGTEIYGMYKDLHPEMEPSLGDITYYKANFSIYGISNQRLQQVIAQAHRKFYLNAWRMMRIARLMPNPAIYAFKGASRLLSRGFLGNG